MSLLIRFAQIPGVRTLWTHFPVGPLATRVQFGISRRPQYAYGVYSAAKLAKRLGLTGITAVELGVAGGRGLVALESIAAEVSRGLGIEIAVVGFDSGEGMPAPVDYRDLPYVWSKGDYKMEVTRLKAQLRRAHLVLGDIETTIPAFLAAAGSPPLGFVAFDLDYYSSTMKAFRLFGGSHESRLPRVYCYFDDIIYPPFACHNEHTGELCAIREFNQGHQDTALSPIHMLRHILPFPKAWHDQMYVFHDFRHPLYCVNIKGTSDRLTQLPLDIGA